MNWFPILLIAHVALAISLLAPSLLLPFLLPPVVGAVQVTARILAERPLSEVAGWLKLLAAFDVVFVVLSTLLFEATLDE